VCSGSVFTEFEFISSPIHHHIFRFNSATRFMGFNFDLRSCRPICYTEIKLRQNRQQNFTNFSNNIIFSTQESCTLLPTSYPYFSFQIIFCRGHSQGERVLRRVLQSEDIVSCKYETVQNRPTQIGVSHNVVKC